MLRDPTVNDLMSNCITDHERVERNQCGSHSEKSIVSDYYNHLVENSRLSHATCLCSEYCTIKKWTVTRPVRMAARAGVHDGVEDQAFVNRIPSSARLSRFGVTAPEPGYAPMESCLC